METCPTSWKENGQHIRNILEILGEGVVPVRRPSEMSPSSASPVSTVNKQKQSRQRRNFRRPGYLWGGESRTRGAAWGRGGCGQIVSPFPLPSQLQPQPLLFTPIPKTEAVSLAMSPCSCVPCMLSTHHPLLWCGSH